MKNLILILISVLPLFLKAQIVSIPDIVFKQKLLSGTAAKDLNGNWTTVDLNNDNLIQQSEANNISELYTVNALNGDPQIQNFTGINSFNNLVKVTIFGSSDNFVLTNKPNLTEVNFEWGTFNNVDLSNNLSLEIFRAGGIFFPQTDVPVSPFISNINFNGCINLKKIDYQRCRTLGTFDGTGLVNLEELLLPHFFINNVDSTIPYAIMSENSNLTSLNITDCVNLKKLDIRGANLQNINLTNLSNLEELKMDVQRFMPTPANTSPDFNPVNLILTGCNSLKLIYASFVNFQSHNFSNLPNLEVLRISNSKNPLPFNVNISECPNLKYFNCGGYYSTAEDFFNHEIIYFGNNSQAVVYDQPLVNQINLTNSLNIENLIVKNNNLTNIDLSGCKKLKNLLIEDNSLTTLDLSNCGVLQYVNCNNNELEFISFKNNINETKSFLNNPDIAYICVDEAELNAVQLIVNLYELWDTCNVGDYCSFVPNGNYNTLNGVVSLDENNNGCDANDMNIQFFKLKLNEGPSVLGSTISNFNGLYKFYVNSGNFTITPQFENPTYFSATPIVANQIFANSDNNIATNNFCITPVGIINDVEVIVVPDIPARPGFNATYRMVFKNKGNQTLSGSLVFNYDDTRLDFVSSTIPSVQSTGQLTFNYTNLLPFENRFIDIVLNVNGSTDTPAVNIDDVLPFIATINPLVGDETPADNTFSFNQIVVENIDPYVVYCLQGNVVSPDYIGEFLHYYLRFENTGSFAVENVVLEYFVNETDYDLNTLQVLNASHELYTRIKSNRIEFIFENIQLQPLVESGGGHGGVVIKMKTQNNLNPSDVVAKQANIYFGYKFPIETNEAETTFVTLSVGTNLRPDSFNVYPNPATDVLNIKTDSEMQKVEFYDVQGRLLQTHINKANETSISMDRYDVGTYFVKIYTSTGVGVKKVMKK